jgi:hypothetical protein
MAIKPTGTPTTITEAIQVFCKQLSPSAFPFYVPVEPWALSTADWCFDNTKEYLGKHQGHGHTAINGWKIWETPGLFLEAEAHSVIQTPKEKYKDITPPPFGGHRILFLPDSFNWDGFMIPNRFFPLSDDPTVVELVTAKAKLAEFRGRFRPGDIVVVAADEAAARKAEEHKKEADPGVNIVVVTGIDAAEYKSLEGKITTLMKQLGLPSLK